MTTFPLPDLTAPSSVHTLEEARDALDRANQQIIDAAIRAAAQERAASEMAQILGRLIAVVEAGRPEQIKTCVGSIRAHYHLDQIPGRKH